MRRLQFGCTRTGTSDVALAKEQTDRHAIKHRELNEVREDAERRCRCNLNILLILSVCCLSDHGVTEECEHVCRLVVLVLVVWIELMCVACSLVVLSSE